MGRGFSDWGTSSGDAGQIGTDVYEIPARMGGIVSVVRTGKVYNAYDFTQWSRRIYKDNPLQWSIELSAKTAIIGEASLRIAPKASDEHLGGVWFAYPHIDTQRLGIEYYIAFEYQTSKTMATHYAQFMSWSNGYRYVYTWQLDTANNTFGINGSYTSSSSFTTIHTFTEGFYDTLYGCIWHNIKLVFDVPNGKWARCYIDGTGYKLSMYTAKTSTTYPKIANQLALTVNQSVDLLPMYLDGLVLTYDEPV